MVSIDFVNHLKPRRVEFFQCIFKNILVGSRKFYTRRNNNKVDPIETGRIVITHLLLRSDLETCMLHHDFLINDDKILSSLLNL